MAITSTYTETYTRIEALQVNVAGALIAAGWQESLVDRLVDVGMDERNRWISAFRSYGVAPNNADVWRYRFAINISWDQFGKLVLTHQTVGVPSDWEQGANPGFLKAASGFKKLLTKKGLKMAPRFEYSSVVRSNPALQASVDKALGAHSAATIKPAGKIERGFEDTVGELSELTFGMDYSSEL
ncbi:hypothetical protein [Gordonia iterans]